MVIFNSYVKLPEGNYFQECTIVHSHTYDMYEMYMRCICILLMSTSFETRPVLFGAIPIFIFRTPHLMVSRNMPRFWPNQQYKDSSLKANFAVIYPSSMVFGRYNLPRSACFFSPMVTSMKIHGKKSHILCWFHSERKTYIYA